jgi:hypothetical protein
MKNKTAPKDIATRIYISTQKQYATTYTYSHTHVKKREGTTRVLVPHHHNEEKVLVGSTTGFCICAHTQIL